MCNEACSYNSPTDSGTHDVPFIERTDSAAETGGPLDSDVILVDLYADSFLLTSQFVLPCLHIWLLRRNQKFHEAAEYESEKLKHKRVKDFQVVSS
jgi:hypothetical protein